jgi:uncharacterized protein (TIGR03790 family)
MVEKPGARLLARGCGIVAGLVGVLAFGDAPAGPATNSTAAAPPPVFDQELTLTTRQPLAITLNTPLVAVWPPPDHSAELAAHLLVVFNPNDPDSQGLAAYYAARRNIPADHVLGLPCETTEEITRAQYDAEIRQPLLSAMVDRHWITRRSMKVAEGSGTRTLLVTDHNDIWAIVLMRGMPLKIAPDPTITESMEKEPELRSNAAAVDSELAMLPTYGLPLGGYVMNPLFDNQAFNPLRVGPDSAQRLILVTRLDAPTPQDVRRMIDDSLYAEKHRLAGLAVIDSRGKTDVKDGYTPGDSWLRRARGVLDLNGWTVKFDDKEELIPATDPCNEVAFYLGWYNFSAVGPWVTPPNRFVRGAIAYHLHSFSASTVRSATSNWVGPLLAHGAAATMGTVYEPYLDLTPHLDIFTAHLMAGQPFAVAAYSSILGLSWMVTVVGDPLYQPFKLPLDPALAAARSAGPAQAEHYDWLLLQETELALAAGTLPANINALEQQLDLLSESAVGEEGLGDLLEKFNDPAAVTAAEEAYRKALTLETQPIDQIRVGLKLAQYCISHAQDEQAQAELRQLREMFPTDSERFGVASLLVPTSSPADPAGAAPATPSGPPQAPKAPRP